MRLYPDVYGRRFAWMLADLVMVAWIYLCVRAGLWVNNLVLQLDALAQGVINAGKTFDSWILSFEQGIPNSVPYPTRSRFTPATRSSRRGRPARAGSTYLP